MERAMPTKVLQETPARARSIRAPGLQHADSKSNQAPKMRVSETITLSCSAFSPGLQEQEI